MGCLVHAGTSESELWLSSVAVRQHLVEEKEK